MQQDKTLNQEIESLGLRTAKAPGNYQKHLIDKDGKTLFTGIAADAWKFIKKKKAEQ